MGERSTRDSRCACAIWIVAISREAARPFAGEAHDSTRL